ncbi:MAG: VOC family protein [Amphiplicatus sp.]
MALDTNGMAPLLQVYDMPEALAFYRDVLGYEVVSASPGPLNEKSWDTSIYIWMESHWQVLVDLSTEDGKSSDLVLHIRIYEVGNSFEFEPGMIYVP